MVSIIWILSYSVTVNNILGPVAIIGTGKTGQSALRVLRHVGVPCATYSDIPHAADFSNPEYLLKTLRPRTLLVSPGFPINTPWIKNFDGEITSDLNLLAAFLNSELVIGVTGSVGKSTVTSLMGVGLKTCDPQVFVGGNLGFPVCDYIYDILKHKKPRAKFLALELSSYQLENCKKLHVENSALTHLSANHLDRYSSINEYFNTKLNIAMQTRSEFFVNTNGGLAKNYIEKSLQNHEFPRELEQSLQQKMHFISGSSLHARELPYLIGPHNKDNFALAFQTIKKWVPQEAALKAMSQWRGLPHRMQILDTKNNVHFVNDSKATSMDSVASAIESARGLDQGKMYILLGGKDKKLPWDDLKKMTLHGATIVPFGECRNLVRIPLSAIDYRDVCTEEHVRLSSAIEWILARVAPHDIVLFSPGGASQDEFRSFEERGELFIKKITEWTP